MVADTGAPADDDEPAQPRAATDHHAAGQDAVLADPHVVPHVHQVVDLRAPLDHRVVDAAAVDRRERPDLDVVAEHQAAHVRDPLVTRGTAVEAEAGAAQDRARLHAHALAQPRPPPDHHVRAQPAVVAQHHVILQHHARHRAGSGRPASPGPRSRRAARWTRPRPAPRRRRCAPSHPRPGPARERDTACVTTWLRARPGSFTTIAVHTAATSAASSSVTRTAAAREPCSSVRYAAETSRERSAGPARSSGATEWITAEPLPSRRPPTRSATACAVSPLLATWVSWWP